MENSMKQLLTLTLVAMLGLATIGCNKTEKVNAAAVATQCDVSNCDPANCDPSKCNKASANCPLQGTPECPMAADRDASDADKRARRARYQEAADKMTEMVKAGEITREQMQQRLDRMKDKMTKDAKVNPAAAGTAKSCCSSKAKAKPAAASNNDASGCSKKKSGACPFSGK